MILFIPVCGGALFAQTGDLVTINLENTSLQKVFSAIEAQTSYRFIYTNEQLKGGKTFTISVNKVHVQAVLKQCFQDQPVNYSLEDKFIIITRKDNEDKSYPIDISGIVKNDKGEPVVGATVTILGTEKATTTEFDGSFILKKVPADATLVFSGANVEKEQIVLHGQQTLNVILKAKINKLDEVQIIAYGTTTRRLSTGSIDKINSETIGQQPVSNPLAAMEGEVPGLDITQVTGMAGGNFIVRIRGQNSIQNGNDPLYVIDGVPILSNSVSDPALSAIIIQGGSALSTLNPKDIESIEVLKDADATAIYGSRGANGVVLITTKTGKSGKSKIDLNLSGGQGNVDRTVRLLNTPQYLQMRREAFANDKETPTLNNAVDLLLWDTTRYTDWQKTLIGQTANILDGQLAISGGNNNTQFRLAGNYYRQTAVFPGSFAYQKISGSAAINNVSTDQKLKIQFTAGYNVENNNLPNLDPTTNIFRLPPDAPPGHDSTGSINYSDGFYQNPYPTFARTYSSTTYNLITDAVISYRILEGLTIKSNLGYSSIHMDETLLIPLSSINPAAGYTSGFSEPSNHQFNNWIVEPQLEYQKVSGSMKWGVLLGSTFNQNETQGTTFFATGFPSDALIQDLSAASFLMVQNETSTLYRYNAFFGRINLNWQDKYLINLTGRRDGSSRFGPDNRFANFGAIGAAWIFSAESFMKHSLPVISYGKLRASYGTNGNDQIGDYSYLDLWQTSYYPYNGTSGLNPANLYNSSFKWETNQKLDIGLELGIARDKLLFTVDYYHNLTTNQLVSYPLPNITGFSFIQNNSPAKLLNSGWEFELNGAIIKNEQVNWNLSVNLTLPNNKLLAYPDLAGSNYANIYEVGKSIYLRKLYHNLGVDPKTGIYTFQDVNNDGQITYPADLTDYKTIAKTCYGGLVNNFQYKNWQLNFTLLFVQQTGYNYQYNYPGAPGSMNNQSAIVLNRWTQPGEITPVQQYTQNTGSEAYQAWFNASGTGDNIISDASFIRLKNLSIAYHFAKNWLERNHLQDIRIYVQAQNLFTISHYQGLDPESQSNSVLPPLRVLTAGIQIIF
ncbi:MAG TPA: SusC/RagA family TonB-linked outer membrane protein [Puia sp.]|nr:SusC/RagA family TonB-linked outer membrane protein [Puia sp.]